MLQLKFSLYVVVFFLITTYGVALSCELDILKAQRIIQGGASPTYFQLSQDESSRLKNIKTYRLRLINVDTNLKSITKNGELRIEWSESLKKQLQLCKDNNLIPRIIIAHPIPKALALKNSDGHEYGPSSWELYDKYNKSFLNYVVNEWGFKDSEWEVGNEMDIPQWNWVSVNKPASPRDMVGFDSYMILYKHVSDTVLNFKKNNPGIRIKLGGPAVSPGGYATKNDKTNWNLMFVDKIAENGLLCDFVSLHVYGNTTNGKDTYEIINKIQQLLKQKNINAEISISEWGASAAGDAELNFQPISGAFALEFLSCMTTLGVNDGIFLATKEFPKNKWPVLFRKNGAPTDTMIVMEYIANLDGVQLPSITSDNNLHSIAVQNPVGDMAVILWNIDWWEHVVQQSQVFYFFNINNDFTVTITINNSNHKFKVKKFLINGQEIQNNKIVILKQSKNYIQISINNTYLHRGDYSFIELK